MQKLTPLQISELRSEMRGLIGKAAKAKATVLAQQFGCSVAAVYAQSRDVRPKRKARADKGKLKALDEKTLDDMLFFTINDDHSAPHICEVAAANGISDVSPATYNRILRQRRLDRKTLKSAIIPHQSWQGHFPNHFHEIDTTVSQQFYIDPDDGAIGWESGMQVYKNKPGNRKPRLTLFSLVDSHSRVRFARFVPNNTTEAWLGALFQAWREKDDPAYFPFHGLPRILYSDNDVVIKSGAFQHAMKILDVEVISHAVGASHSKGKVENSFKILQEFEKVTKRKKWQSLDEANEALTDYLYYLNNKIHGTTGRIPFEHWLTIEPRRLKAPPGEELFNLLHLGEAWRKIYDDLVIHIHGQKFQLPWQEPFLNFIRQKVLVYWRPRDLSTLYVVLDGKSYEIEAKDKIVHGAGQREELPVPVFLQKKQELEARAKKDEAPDLQLTGFYKKRHAKPYMIGKEAKRFDDAKIDASRAQGPMRSKAWFIWELQKLQLVFPPLAPNGPEHEFFDKVFGDHKEMPETELRTVIAALQSGEISIRGGYQQQAT